MKLNPTKMLLVLTIALFFSGPLLAAKREIGERCTTDGQCLSSECKKFRCVQLNEKAKPTGNATIEAMLRQFDTITPVLNEAGFTIHKLKIDVKLVPVVSAYVRQARTLNRPQQQEILDTNKNNKYLAATLKTLFTIYSFSFGNYNLTESIIQLNPPKATIFLEAK